jgi:hypothetical protein
MSRSNNALLANRVVSICIDSSVSCGCLTLSLAPVRMDPSARLLTTLVEEFAREEIVPVVQAYLSLQNKENSPLYVPGCAVPRDIHRLVQVYIERPLMEELECFVLKSKPKTVQAEKVEMIISTSAVGFAPVFAPVQSHGSGSLTTSKPAKDSKPQLPPVAQEVRVFSNYVALWGG